MVVTEADPHGKAAHEPGAKLDAGKVRAALLKDFALALVEVGKVSTYGAQKYSVGGWQHADDGIARYDDAKWRHMLAERHESHDRDTGLRHAAHEAWNALARLELLLRADTPSTTDEVRHPGAADAEPQHSARSHPAAGKASSVSCLESDHG